MLSWLPARLREFEAGKIKAGRNHAADEAPSCKQGAVRPFRQQGGFRLLPDASRHDVLRSLDGAEINADNMAGA